MRCPNVLTARDSSHTVQWHGMAARLKEQIAAIGALSRSKVLPLALAFLWLDDGLN